MSLLAALWSDEPVIRYQQRKLNADQVVTIRTLYGFGAKQASLARKFGVSQGQISKIVNGKQWKAT